MCIRDRILTAKTANFLKTYTSSTSPTLMKVASGEKIWSKKITKLKKRFFENVGIFIYIWRTKMENIFFHSFTAISCVNIPSSRQCIMLTFSPYDIFLFGRKTAINAEQRWKNDTKKRSTLTVNSCQTSNINNGSQRCQIAIYTYDEKETTTCYHICV